MTITTELVAWIVGTSVGMCTLAGLAVRFVLVPYLRDHIVAPVAETRDQVANDHDSNLREDVDQLDAKLDQVIVAIAEVGATMKANRQADQQALRVSEQVHRDLWAAVNDIRLRRPPAR